MLLVSAQIGLSLLSLSSCLSMAGQWQVSYFLPRRLGESRSLSLSSGLPSDPSHSSIFLRLAWSCPRHYPTSFHPHTHPLSPSFSTSSLWKKHMYTHTPDIVSFPSPSPHMWFLTKSEGIHKFGICIPCLVFCDSLCFSSHLSPPLPSYGCIDLRLCKKLYHLP